MITNPVGLEVADAPPGDDMYQYSRPTKSPKKKRKKATKKKATKKKAAKKKVAKKKKAARKKK